MLRIAAALKISRAPSYTGKQLEVAAQREMLCIAVALIFLRA